MKGEKIEYRPEEIKDAKDAENLEELYEILRNKKVSEPIKREFHKEELNWEDIKDSVIRRIEGLQISYAWEKIITKIGYDSYLSSFDFDQIEEGLEGKINSLLELEANKKWEQHNV